MIIVFLNNRLINSDTVIPLMMAARDVMPGRRIKFYCFNIETFRAIQSNVVLWDALVKIGTLENFSYLPKGGLKKLISQLSNFVKLMQIFFPTILSRVHFIHSRALNEWPFRLLYKINRRRTIFIEPDCWGYNKGTIESIYVLNPHRKREVELVAASSFIAFGVDFPQMNHPSHKSTKKVIVPSSHLYVGWHDFIIEESKQHLATILRTHGWPEEQKVFSFMLNFFGKLPALADNEVSLRLFKETIEILSEEVTDIPVILKLHPLTCRVAVHEHLSKFPQNRFIVADLHPMVLATRSLAFIGNYCSTVFVDGVAMGVTTIEYTEYSREALAATGDKSMRPKDVTHFINRDPDAFRELIRSLARSGEERKSLVTRPLEDFLPAIELLR